MIFTLIDIVIDLTFWTTKKIYNTGHYIIYGPSKSEAQLLIENKESIELLRRDILELQSKLDQIEK